MARKRIIARTRKPWKVSWTTGRKELAFNPVAAPSGARVELSSPEQKAAALAARRDDRGRSQARAPRSEAEGVR